MSWDWSAIGTWVLKFSVVIVAPLAGIGGTLLGASIANRSALRRWKLERQESRLSLARKAAIEVAESSYLWESAQYDYGRFQCGIQSAGMPAEPTLSASLNAAKTRQAIAFATLYVSVRDEATIQAARSLEAKREPLQKFVGDDAMGIMNDTGNSRNQALVRLIIAWSDFDGGIREYIEAIAPLLAPVPES